MTTARKKSSGRKPAPKKTPSGRKKAPRRKAATKATKVTKAISPSPIHRAFPRSASPIHHAVEHKPPAGRGRRGSLLPWAIAAGLGFLLLSSKRSAGATLPPLPKPTGPLPLPPLALPPGAASPPPLPPTSIHPDAAGGASWSPDGKTLNSLQGYHRAKNSEVTSEVVAAARGALSGHDIGQIVYGTTSTGVSYAIALEEHYHPPGGAEKPWGPHKGSSVFVAN